jgi:outer membrane protein assembly factor BamB
MPDAEQRSPVWTREIGAPVWADVAFANGAVFVGDESGRLRALDSKTGAERWIATTGGRIRSRAVVRGSGAWIQSDDGHVYRFDASTGRETLKVRVNEKTPERLPPGPKSRFDRFASTIAFSNGRGFVGAHDGAVVAFDESTGVRAWSFKAGDAVLSTPAIARGRVYFGSFDHHVYAVDESTGALVWKRDTGAPVVSQPLAHEGLVVVGSRSYDLMGLDASTGAPRWNRYVWFSWIESNVARHGGTGYVGSSDAAKVFAFDLTTGKPVWEADAHGWAWGEPAVTDDRVYVGTSGTPGYLVGHESSILAFDRMTGTVAWWHRLTPPAGKDPYGVTGSLATGDGLVFAGALDGRLLAFRR